MSAKKFILAGLFVAGPVFAAPDYAPINKALNDFLAVVESLKTDLPQVRDAAGAAKAVDSFAAVTNAFAQSLEDYVRKYPELARAPQPPPEMAGVLKKFAESKDIYPTLGADLGRAINPFSDDPAVHAAIERFQQGMARMDKLGGAH